MLSVTFRTVCSMKLDRTCMSKYLRQTDEADWQATKSRPSSSEKFTKVGNSVNEVSNIEIHELLELIFIHLFIYVSHSSQWLRLQSSQLEGSLQNDGIDMTWQWTEIYSRHNSSFFFNIVSVNGLRKSRTNFHYAEFCLEGNLELLRSESLRSIVIRYERIILK